MIGHVDYLNTEYDGEQDGNEYIPGTAPDTKGRRVV